MLTMHARCHNAVMLITLVTLALLHACQSIAGAESTPEGGGPDIRAGDLDWWKKTIVYQIYPRSFRDTDGDGVGDLQGIISRLDYFNFLGVETIWLSPIYKSPMADHGYDIQDFVDIDPTFGTLADFDQLIKQAHSQGIRVIMDFVPNHSSNLHHWFIESRKGGADNPYRDFYTWSDGKILENGTRVPPNGWRGCFVVPAWTWDEVRGQYYLHQFAKEQPDLNYRNPAVVKEMDKVLQFWLERGADGFRVDAISTLFETEDLSLEEPRSFKPGVQEHEENYYDHIHTRDRLEIHDIVRRWRGVLDEHDRKAGGHTFMVTEIYSDMDKTMLYYHSGADMPFNFNLVLEDLHQCGGTCFQGLINKWMDAMPSDKWPNFVLGNHDRKRISHRKGVQYVDALNVLLLLLPGTPTTYYGEEIGMRDIEVSYEDTQDPWGINLGPELYKAASRDPCRSPMQWSVQPNAGFSEAEKPWLPVHPNYEEINVQLQFQEPGSTLGIYRRAAELRRKPEFQTNRLDFVVVNDNVLSFTRRVDARQSSAVYLVAVNVGVAESTDDYKVESEKGRSYEWGVVVIDTRDADRADTTVRLKGVKLAVGQAVVFRLTDAELGKGGTKEEL